MAGKPFFEINTIFPGSDISIFNTVPSIARLPNDDLLTVWMGVTGTSKPFESRRIMETYSKDNGAALARGFLTALPGLKTTMEACAVSTRIGLASLPKLRRVFR